MWVNQTISNLSSLLDYLVFIMRVKFSCTRLCISQKWSTLNYCKSLCKKIIVHESGNYAALEIGDKPSYKCLFRYASLIYIYIISIYITSLFIIGYICWRKTVLSYRRTGMSMTQFFALGLIRLITAFHSFSSELHGFIHTEQFIPSINFTVII